MDELTINQTFRQLRERVKGTNDCLIFSEPCTLQYIGDSLKQPSDVVLAIREVVNSHLLSHPTDNFDYRLFDKDNGGTTISMIWRCADKEKVLEFLNSLPAVRKKNHYYLN